MAGFDSDIDLSGVNASPAELQRMLAVEQQKAQLTAQIHTFTDKCMGKPGPKLDSRTDLLGQLCGTFYRYNPIHYQSLRSYCTERNLMTSVYMD